MAALSRTGKRTFRFGPDAVMETFRVTTTASSATEWVATNLKDIDVVVSAYVVGSAGLAPVQATNTITCLVADPADNDTISIGNGTTTMVYKVETTPADRGDVDLNAAIATFGASLTAAINGLVEGSASTFDPFTASNPWVTAVFADPIITVTAIVPGTIGNAYTLAQTGDTVSVGAATFSGGIDTGGINIVKNAQGTGVTEGVNRGDLGIETSEAVTVEVSVIGRPR